MQRAIDELMVVRDRELHGVFDFKVLDRRAYDTRVALPQTVQLPAGRPNVV